ncbi:uncharacterized protein LOC131888952 isoform X1 [Tigriopus californicus]|uniref:uncharacterized protein LOC131888952 isoform X1 n=1 Tax=Tigriopus californicus TaxID=6832 RepID=UPI0027D9E993|nr:uncharacterized protein LOC131888952 isoform X1 [Tigriopus californicus]XP_059093910.1 uncharacterized protein LOC131888952 isoform X1 [Tigriopus californicus]
MAENYHEKVQNLPMIRNKDKVYVTGIGLETFLLFENGLPMPHFASFTALQDATGRNILVNLYHQLIEVAKSYKVDGIVLDTPTWRANPDWARKLDVDESGLKSIYKESLDILNKVKVEHATPEFEIILMGTVGPRGDGYQVKDAMTAVEAEKYHSFQIGCFANIGVDGVFIATLSYPEEAIGFIRASKKAGVPCVVSFTVETNGDLPNGISLKEAILQVEDATDNAAAYFMINCAHPTHFEANFKGDHEPWMKRIQCVRCNPSTKSHAELDGSTSLDSGDAILFGKQVTGLKKALPCLNVFGGCCGSNAAHLEEICKNISP